MRYMCLIYENEALLADRSAEEQEKMFADYMTFTNKVAEAGVMEAGAPLLETNTATTVRVRDGKASNTDGPFAETKEQLGGYYILDCKDLDQALGFAAEIPGARNGSIEVRPIMETGG